MYVTGPASVHLGTESVHSMLLHILLEESPRNRSDTSRGTFTSNRLVEVSRSTNDGMHKLVKSWNAIRSKYTSVYGPKSSLTLLIPTETSQCSQIWSLGFRTRSLHGPDHYVIFIEIIDAANALVKEDYFFSPLLLTCGCRCPESLFSM